MTLQLCPLTQLRANQQKKSALKIEHQKLYWGWWWGGGGVRVGWLNNCSMSYSSCGANSKNKCENYIEIFTPRRAL